MMVNKTTNFKKKGKTNGKGNSKGASETYTQESHTIKRGLSLDLWWNSSWYILYTPYATKIAILNIFYFHHISSLEAIFVTSFLCMFRLLYILESSRTNFREFRNLVPPWRRLRLTNGACDISWNSPVQEVASTSRALGADPIIRCHLQAV